MICLCKPIKNQAPKTTSIDKAFALADRTPQPEPPVAWSTYTPGPYLVPVTRWIE
jgi:hypothetical protein